MQGGLPLRESALSSKLRTSAGCLKSDPVSLVLEAKHRLIRFTLRVFHLGLEKLLEEDISLTLPEKFNID